MLLLLVTALSSDINVEESSSYSSASDFTIDNKATIFDGDTKQKNKKTFKAIYNDFQDQLGLGLGAGKYKDS